MARLTPDGVRFSVGDELNSRRQIFATSTAWLFYQTAAPTGWTKVLTHNDKSLRLVSGTGGGSGGTNSFSTVMGNFNIGGSFSFPTGSTGDTSITLDQTPIHSHDNAGSIGLNAVPINFNPAGVLQVGMVEMFNVLVDGLETLQLQGILRQQVLEIRGIHILLALVRVFQTNQSVLQCNILML